MPALELTLPKIASIEADGTIFFNAAIVDTIATSQQSFMIFYLTKEDEQNGYGTVIQLDEQHAAAIYPDLNPEYTYLFYKDEQGQLQSLLWCIELATRNPDGLYVAQAKVHGRGVTQADLDRFNQIMLTQPPASSAPAQPTHDLSESYSPTPAATPISPSPAVAPPAFSSPAPAPAAPSVAPTPAAPQWNTPAPSAIISSTPIAIPSSEPQTAPEINLPPLPDLGAPTQPSTPVTQPAASLADLGLSPLVETPDQPEPVSEAISVDQPADPLPEPTPAPEPLSEAQLPDLSPLPQLPDLQPPAPHTTTPQPAAASFPSLPPLPTMPQSTPVQTQQPPVVATQPELNLPSLPPLPTLPSQPTPPQLNDATPQAEPQSQPESQAFNPQPEKNPVGRPPKPLLSDAAWRVDQTDFAWAKAVSRESIEPHKNELRAKLQSQIERNQAELLQNPAFQPALDQAFQAICQAYELAPTARQDLLKSLLNGRVVENIAEQLDKTLKTNF